MASDLWAAREVGMKWICLYDGKPATDGELFWQWQDGGGYCTQLARFPSWVLPDIQPGQCVRVKIVPVDEPERKDGE